MFILKKYSVTAEVNTKQCCILQLYRLAWFLCLSLKTKTNKKNTNIPQINQASTSCALVLLNTISVTGVIHFSLA